MKLLNEIGVAAKEKTKAFRQKTLLALGIGIILLQLTKDRSLSGILGMVKQNTLWIGDPEGAVDNDGTLSHGISFRAMQTTDSVGKDTNSSRLVDLKARNAKLESEIAELKAQLSQKQTSDESSSSSSGVAPSSQAAADEPVVGSQSNKEAWKEVVPTALVYMPYANYPDYEYSKTKEKIRGSYDRNYFQNGMEESPFLRLAAFNETAELILQNKPVSWIFDASHLRPKWACDVLFAEMKKAQERVWQMDPTHQSPTWSIGLIDPRDHGWEIFDCPKSMDVWLKNISKTVPYWKRSMVTERTFNTTTKVLDPGKLHPGIVNLLPYPGQDQPSPTLSSMPMHHSPINVRTDMVEALSNILAKDSEYTTQNLTLASPIESLFTRPRDVAHFYPPTLEGYRDEAPKIANLRLTVSQTILEFAEEESIQRGKDAPKLDVFANKVGEAAEKGRASPQDAYIKEMLNTKIVVLAQRDVWEDHWRFFEAMISGAMVMTDTLLSMPAGLAHGESIVVYHNMTQLKDQMRFYLDPANEAKRIAIATKGRFVAMNQHRSWHRMEEIAFGEIKSTCAVSRFPECPYTVHAT